MRRAECALCVSLLWLAGCPAAGRRGSGDAQLAAEGSIELASQPAGAVVMAHGERLGRTPLVLRRPAGARLVVQVIKQDYVSTERALLFTAHAQQLQVELRPDSGHIVILAGALRGAAIHIDGDYRGRAPDRVRVDVGEHLVRLVQPGFHPYTERVRVRAREDLRLEAELVLIKPGQSAPGWISIDSDVPALARLGTRLLGSVPARFRLAPGRQIIEVRSSALGRARSVTVDVVAGLHQRVAVQLGDSRADGGTR